MNISLYYYSLVKKYIVDTKRLFGRCQGSHALHLSVIEDRNFCQTVARAEKYEFVESVVGEHVQRLPYGCIYFTESRRVMFNENVDDRTTDASKTVVHICKHDFLHGK